MNMVITTQDGIAHELKSYRDYEILAEENGWKDIVEVVDCMITDVDCILRRMLKLNPEYKDYILDHLKNFESEEFVNKFIHS